MVSARTKRMKRVLSVLTNLRRLEEARLGELQGRSSRLKSAQTDAILKLNDEGRFEGSFAENFADLIASQVRSDARKKQEVKFLSDQQRGRVANRRGQEKMTESQIARLKKQIEKSNKAAELFDVLDVHVGKPPASK